MRFIVYKLSMANFVVYDNKGVFYVFLDKCYYLFALSDCLSIFGCINLVIEVPKLIDYLRRKCSDVVHYLSENNVC